MTVRYTTLYRFYNEAVEGSLRNLGCGYRSVLALPPGRKWITLLDWTTLDVATVSIADWARMKPEPTQARSARILASIKHRLPYKFDDGKPTGTIKEALAILKAGEA